MEDGTAIGAMCRKVAISAATFYTWRQTYAGLMPSGTRRLRQPEEENGKPKRLVAGQGRTTLSHVGAAAIPARRIQQAPDF